MEEQSPDPISQQEAITKLFFTNEQDLKDFNSVQSLVAFLRKFLSFKERGYCAKQSDFIRNGFSSAEIKMILEKLADDGYVSTEVDSHSPFRTYTQYRLTFEGKYFIENIGYEKNSF